MFKPDVLNFSLKINIKRSFIMEKKLYKSSTDKMLAGVCGGLGEYFEIDSTLVRIGYAILCLFAGGGILLYIICAIVMPRKPIN